MRKNGNVTRKDTEMSHLKIARRKAKLTQEKVRAILNDKYHLAYSREQISHWENGKENPSKNVIDCLATIYNVAPTYLTEEIPWATWDDFHIDKARREYDYIQSRIFPFVTCFLRNAGISLEKNKELSTIEMISRAIFDRQLEENGYTRESPFTLESEWFHVMFHSTNGELIQKPIKWDMLVSNIYRAYRTTELLSKDFQNLISKV